VQLTAWSNGRAEALNAQVNALITRARGFRTAEALIAAIHFTHGGLCSAYAPKRPGPERMTDT
jgi:Transposase